MPVQTTTVESAAQEVAKLNLKSDYSDALRYANKHNNPSILTEEEIQKIYEESEKIKSSQEHLNYNIYGLKVEITEDHILRLPEAEIEASNYKEWLPTWNPTQKFEPYELFEFEDRGLNADPELKNLFKKGAKYETKEITPKFGTEIDGIQLSELTDEGKNDLARFVGERGVVVFKNQDLKDKGPKFAVEWAEYFGPLQVHPTVGAAEVDPRAFIVYKPRDSVKPQDHILKKHTKALSWHTDVSYEKQPAGVTFLGLIEGPASGGDTIFADTTEAYNRLSPEFQKILEKLKVKHSGLDQVQRSAESIGIVRREGVENIHPLIRSHPVTGKKSLYAAGFSREIIGLKVEESAAILDFINDHIYTSIDLHARVRWEPGSIAVWDNRRSAHTALFDWDSDEARHLFRLTPRAEAPYVDASD